MGCDSPGFTSVTVNQHSKFGRVVGEVVWCMSAWDCGFLVLFHGGLNCLALLFRVVVLVLGVNPFLQSGSVNSTAMTIRAAFLVRDPGNQVKLSGSTDSYAPGNSTALKVNVCSLRSI